MTTENFTTTILTASEGMFLTQADDQIKISERIVCSQVALGRYDAPENWKEITAQEAELIKADIEAFRQAEEEAARLAAEQNIEEP